MPTTINEFTVEPRTPSPEPSTAEARASAEAKPLAESERETVENIRRAREREMRLWAY